MEKIARFAYAPLNEEGAHSVIASLKRDGYEILDGKQVDDTRFVVIVFLEKTTTASALYEALPWLKEQFAYSSLIGFRVMPMFGYHHKTEDPEAIFDGEFGEMVEEIFSGEFKPYGWDFDDPQTIVEFNRIFEEGYSE